MKITITKNQTTILIECESSDNPDIIVGKIIQAMENETMVYSDNNIKGKPGGRVLGSAGSYNDFLERPVKDASTYTNA